jgi:hypothetical protein
MRPDQLERRLRARLDALGPAPRAELLHVLMLPDFERADAIGSYWGTPRPGPSPNYSSTARRTGPSERYSSACCGRPSASLPLVPWGTVEPDNLRLRERINAISPAARAELLHALLLPESESAARIGGYGSAASIARLTELYEDARRDPALRAVLVGMLAEMEQEPR